MRDPWGESPKKNGQSAEDAEALTTKHTNYTNTFAAKNAEKAKNRSDVELRLQ